MISSELLFPARSRWLKIDYLLIFLAGLICLSLSYVLLYKGATLSDELVYAVVARNIVERHTLNTTVYRADSIVLRGYPARDHHMPGYVLTLAAVFALLGMNQVTIGLPSQIAYLLGGLIFYRLSKTLFSPFIAFWATLLFYLYPVNFVTANLVLVEACLNLIVVIYLAYWVKVSRIDLPRLRDGVILAGIIIVGMIFRETFILFLLPALVILLVPTFKHRAYRPVLGFGFVFGLLLLTLFWPLSQHRNYYPFGFNEAVEAQNWLEKTEIVTASFLKNISATNIFIGGYFYTALLNLLLGVIISGVGLKLFYRSHKLFVLLAVYLFWSALILLTMMHTHILDWSTPRHMYTFLLPGLPLLAAAIFQLKLPSFRRAILLITVILVGVIAFQTADSIARDQRRYSRYFQTTSDIVTKYLKPYQPQTLMFDQAFQAAWDHYPLTLIWSYPNNYEEMQALEQHLLVDVIVVDNEPWRDIILKAGETGLLKHKYTLLFPYKVEGYYFLIREELQLQANHRF